MEGGIQGWDRGLEHGLTSSSFLPVLAPRTTLGPGSSQQQAQLLGVGVQAALLTALAQSPPPPYYCLGTSAELGVGPCEKSFGPPG